MLLPRVDETLDTLSGFKWLICLVGIGRWPDREKTGFSTPDGFYEFKVMPFGLCNALDAFQRLMDAVLMSLQWSRCLVYIDDVGRNFKDHLQNDRFREALLKLYLKKCRFGKKEWATLYLQMELQVE